MSDRQLKTICDFQNEYQNLNYYRFVKSALVLKCISSLHESPQEITKMQLSAVRHSQSIDLICLLESNVLLPVLPFGATEMLCADADEIPTESFKSIRFMWRRQKIKHCCQLKFPEI